MNKNISITRVSKSKVDKVDFNNIPFGKTFSDHMFVADFIDGEWQNLQVVPFQNMEFSPASLVFHYGQAIFEGMKATKKNDGTTCLFRLKDYSKRFNESARRMAMPLVPENLFVESLTTLIDIDRNWIPQKEGSALYVRPFMIATDAMLGVKSSKTYKFIIFTGPVGPYYPRPLKLIAAEKYVRAVKGGVGEAKTGGNYAATLYPMYKAMDKGFDQIMWLDSKEFKYIQEAGTMNLFFVIGDTVITPATDGTILKGITRDSFIKILKYKGYKLEERQLSIDELVTAYHNKTLREAFGSGTAAVVANIEGIQYKDLYMDLPSVETHTIAKLLKAEINGMRSGALEDYMNWMHAVPNTSSKKKTYASS